MRKASERVPFLTVRGFVMQLLGLGIWLSFGWFCCAFCWRFAQVAGWL